MSPTVYLISGANRGIGFGLVKALAARPDVVVFAGARNPDSAHDLKALQTKYPGKVHIVKLTSAVRKDNEAAVKEIKQVVGKLDVVIANAAIAKFYGSILDTPEEEIREHHEVNVIGPIVLFQSVWPLLKESPKPTFVIISSLAGSIAGGAPLPVMNFAYGVTKAADNHFAMKLHAEHPELIVLDIHPGLVETDMASFGKQKEPILMELLKPISVDESVSGIVKLLDGAKRTEDGPKLLSWEGEVLPW